MSEIKALLQKRKIRFLPLCHYKAEFAYRVRQEILAHKPDCLAVELPSSIRQQYLLAVRRLPFLSILIYENESGAVHLPIEPCDAFVEGVRTALELNLPIEFIDCDTQEYPTLLEPYPDSYSLKTLSLEDYHLALKKRPLLPQDRVRESFMGSRLLELESKYTSIYCLLGQEHTAGVMASLDQPIQKIRPLIRPPKARLYQPSEESALSCMAEQGFFSAAWEHFRQPKKPEVQPIQAKTRHKGFLRALFNSAPPPDIKDQIKALLVRQPENHFPCRKVLLQMAFDLASVLYREKWSEEIKIWQRRAMSLFLTRLAKTQGRLLAHPWDAIRASKGIIDDEFAYLFWEILSIYPHFPLKSELPIVEVDADTVWKGSRQISFQRKIPKEEFGRQGLPRKLRPKEKKAGQFLRPFKYGLCSWPEEDVVVESFARFLQKSAEGVLAARKEKLLEFQSSLLDGIDLKETIRNWHNGKIFVRELAKDKDRVGSVVVIFDEDEEDRKFPYRMCWHGEHDQESDLAFYATDFSSNMLAEGIGRSVYGGFLMIYPPGRMMDIWRDPQYLYLNSKKDILLVAGLEYCLEKYMVLLAKKPPREGIQRLASLIGKQIIHLPLHSMSPTRLSKLRRFHVLSGQDKRPLVGDFL